MALTDQLVAYWKLEEASGPRADSAGANTLTDVNTVTQAAGKIGNAGQFTAANTEYLSRADNAALSMGVGVHFTFAAWVYPDTLGAMAILSKFGSEYLLDTQAGVPRLFVSSGLSYSSALIVSTWNLVIAWYDGAERGIQVDDGVPVTQVFSTDATDGAAEFRIGHRVDTPASDYWNGRIDEVGIWKRAITVQERADLWNGGAGFNPFGGGAVQSRTRMGIRIGI